MDKVGPFFDAYFFIDILYVGFYGVQRDEQFILDLFVAPPLGQQGQYFLLSGGEIVRGGDLCQRFIEALGFGGQILAVPDGNTQVQYGNQVTAKVEREEEKQVLLKEQEVGHDVVN